jgi:hypothetical protein
MLKRITSLGVIALLSISLTPAVSLATANTNISSTVQLNDFNSATQIQKLTNACSDITNPNACLASAQGFAGQFGEMANQIQAQATTYLNGLINQGISNIVNTLGVGGLLESGGSPAIPTTKQLEAANPNSIQAIASQAQGIEAAANNAAANLLRSGIYQPEIGEQVVQAQSQALGNAATGLQNLQTIQTSLALAAQDVEQTNQITSANYDSSLDALNAANKSAAAVVRGQERLSSALANNSILIGQSLKQSVAATRAIDVANKRYDAERNALSARQNRQTCYIASMISSNTCN